MAGAETTPNSDLRGEDLGPPSLTTVGVLGQTLAIGPIFSAAFLPGTVAVFAGFNTPLSVLLAGLGTLGLAYALMLYARRFAGAGASTSTCGVAFTHPSVSSGAARICSACCSSGREGDSWRPATS